jgi:hypothetical protein
MGGGEESNSFADSGSLQKKGPNELAKLQRLFFFHGHTLVISMILRNHSALPTGLPFALFQDIYDLGCELLQNDVSNAVMSMRHVLCSIVRGGSLIVCSCISLGYEYSRFGMQKLLETFDRAFRWLGSSNSSNSSLSGTMNSQVNSSGVSVNGPPPANSGRGAVAGEEMIYEIMSIEALLVCISSLLQFNAEALYMEEKCLEVVVESLEVAFRAVKGKYQPGFRTHFRFRTLHVILLECFALLPPGTFPNSVQQIYVEALRVFRDCIGASCECSSLGSFFPEDYLVLAYSHTSSTLSPDNIAGATQVHSLLQADVLSTETAVMLKLEANAVSLSKKESEAFLAVFGKDLKGRVFSNSSFNESDSAGAAASHYGTGGFSVPAYLSRPSAQIDSRTIDSAVLLLASTFVLQSMDYQEKAIQLCVQAVAQLKQVVTKSGSSMGIFTSDEERRRKEKKIHVTTRSIMWA